MADDEQKTELWESHVLQAHAALDRDDFDEAQGLLDYAFHEAAEYGAENPRVAHVLSQQSIISYRKGQYKEALDLLTRAHNIFQASDEKTELAVVCASIAGVLRASKEEDESEKYLLKAIALIEGRDNERLSDFLVVLASHQKRCGKDQESFSTLERVLRTQEKIFGTDHHSLKPILTLLADEADELDCGQLSSDFRNRASQLHDTENNEQDYDWRFTSLDVLNVLNNQEQAQYAAARKYLGSSVSLFQLLADMYDQLAVYIGQVKFESDWETLYAFTCCLHGCRYQLLMGALTLLRGHRTDSSTYTRKAIEFATFSIVILRNQPAKRGKEKCPKCGHSDRSSSKNKKTHSTADLWLHSHNSKSAFDKYRKSFEIMTALRQTESLFPTLYKKYEELSKQVHPTFIAIAGHTRMIEDSDGMRHLFEYFESRGENKLKLIAFTLLWTVEIHYEILCGLAKGAHERSKFDFSKWSQDLENVKSQIVAEKEHWRPILDPEGKYRPKDDGDKA